MDIPSAVAPRGEVWKNRFKMNNASASLAFPQCSRTMAELPTRQDSYGDARGRQVACAECPLRERAAFKAKSDDAIALVQALKTGHIARRAGTTIIEQGDQDARLFTLFSGWAFRSRMLPDGRRQILNILLPGDLLGLQAHLQDVSDHAIEALTDVELCQFARTAVWKVFQHEPETAYELAWLGSREENLVDENLTSVGQRTARERMAALVLSLYRRCRELGLVQDESFAFPLTRVHLADTLGLSLVHTIKTWTYLRRLGLFSIADGRLKLVNPRLTERWAQAYDRPWRPRPLL
jgi:CRP-like cAMP-binding protein